jgi:hypothetical protein
MTATHSNDVGYRRPPKANQFQKGQSGNPSGRPKGSTSLSTKITAALSERVTVVQNGKRRSISKLEAAFAQLANKAAAGDRHAAKLLIEMLHQSESRDDARADMIPINAEEHKAQDLAILAAIRASALNIVPEATNDPSI